MSDSIQISSGATKADIITSFVQRELQAAVKLLGLCQDVSRFAVKGAKSISFPKLTSYTAVDRSFGSASEAAVLTDSVDKLELNHQYTVSSIIDSGDALQSSIEWKTEALSRKSSAIGRAIDGLVIATLSAAYCDYINTTASAAVITEDNIVDLHTYLIRNEANPNGLYLAIDPASEGSMLKIDNFIRTSDYGNSNGVQNGVIGKVFGFNVIVSNLLTANTVYAFSDEAVAVGFQKAPSYSEQPDNRYGSMGVRICMDTLVGAKALHTAEGKKKDGSTSVASGKSGLIFTLNQH
jgi:hypothetical protein